MFGLESNNEKSILSFVDGIGSLKINGSDSKKSNSSLAISGVGHSGSI